MKIIRPDSSDDRVAKEVIQNHAYSKKSIGFDVEPGERWLDLGANIGAFAVYAVEERGAAGVMCYEPDLECLKLLRENAPYAVVVPHAVGATARSMPWYRSQSLSNFSRGTFLPSSKSVPAGEVKIKSVAGLKGFDGIKMDVEGAEGELIDAWAIPKANKLVLEYHSSRDTIVSNFVRRLKILQSKYDVVSYPPEFDRIIADKLPRFERWIDDSRLPRGGRFVQYPMADRLIFCMGRKK